MSQEKKQTQTRKEKESMFEVVRIHRIENSEYLKAFVDITVCDALLIKGIRVLSGKEGRLFISMPTHQAKDGKYSDNVRPLVAEAKKELEEVVFSAYQS